MGRTRGATSSRVFAWVWQQSMKVKVSLGAVTLLCSLVALAFLSHEHNHFFVVDKIVHFMGILVLIYKLTTMKTCSGLSLKTQELTAIFVAARLCCSYIFSIDGDIHTFLDFGTLVSTAWVVYMIRFKLTSTYTAELDNMTLYYVAVPCAILAVLIHPFAHRRSIGGVLWAFSVYLESVSVLPQLRMIQNAKMIEPFTAHYVFAMGIARFIRCAHWIIQVYDSAGKYLYLVGAGYFWIPMVYLAEIVQTFILADFCYYYIKSVVNGQLIVSLPSHV